MDIILPNSLPDPGVGALHYDSGELDILATLLREAINPTQIIFFGSLAGATPHSDMAAYDLLVVTTGSPDLDWLSMRDYLRFKYPLHCRLIPFVNLYVCTESDINGQMYPFYRLALSEGEIPYTRQTLWRKKCDYQACHTKALSRFEFSFNRGCEALLTAQECMGRNDIRQAAILTAYAAEALLRALYAAYHAHDTDLHELPTLFLRNYTLSTRLTMLLDPENSSASRMLARLENYRRQAFYDAAMKIDPAEIADYLSRTERMKVIVEQLSRGRLHLYLERQEEAERLKVSMPIE